MKPAIGITTGCLHGIGPEVVSKAIKDPQVLDICEPRIFGSLEHRDKKYKIEECGLDSMRAVDEAIKAAMTGEIKAIVTAPINKSHWKAAGSPFLGHTEYLAHVTGTKNFAMMMASPKLKVVLVTTHIPLSQVASAITTERICEVTRLVNTVAKIAICGLNPHAGDSGTFGDEEERIIIPAIKILQSEGINVSGPYAADTIFYKAANGEFDTVVAMYHDQALIPVKTLDFKHTVNVTIGLPFVRTSPDHGTAEDIADKGIADHGNMVEAIKMALKLTGES